jgi:uncharacterized paraquat-inducible protein A
MKHAIPCPECDSTGMKVTLEEVDCDKTFRCPHCGSRFGHGKANPLQAIAVNPLFTNGTMWNQRPTLLMMRQTPVWPNVC